MTQSGASLERKRLHAVAREYEGRGYRVIKRPSKARLPDFLSAFRPDLIAYGPGESVVVEVETKATLPRANDLIALSEAVNAKPGWRLEPIVTNDRYTTAAACAEGLGQREARARIALLIPLHQSCEPSLEGTSMADVGFTLWLEFEIAQGFDPDDDFCNIKVTLSNGEVYALNIWTYRFLDTAQRQDQASGENLRGGYLKAPDLFVERLERALLERVVADLLRSGGLKAQWRVPNDTPVQETASAK